MNNRKKSAFYQLRVFHNEQKRRLITRFVTRGSTVCELGFGRGGDLDKYRRVGVARIHAFDPSVAARDEALRRNTQSRVPLDYTVAKMQDARLERPADVTCLMFSLHYGWEDMERTLDVIARCTRVGGVVLGIMIDMHQVEQRLQRPFTDSHFRIERLDAGIAFHLCEDQSTGLYQPSRERLVSWPDLCAGLSRRGFIVQETRLLARHLGRELGATERDVASLSRTFAFAKITDIPCNLST